MNSAKRALWGLSCGHFILDMYAAILIPLYPIIAQRLQINLAEISLVIAIGFSVSSILQPVFGYVSDKLQKRFFMFWGLIFAAVFVPLGYFAPNSAILTLCLILGMAGNAFYHPQVTLIIKNFYEENIALSRAIGIFLGLGTIGYSIAPYLSGFIIEKFGSYFIYTGLIGIITAFILLFFVPKIEKKEQKSASNFYLALKEIVKNQASVFLIVLSFLKACLVMSFSSFIPFLLKNYGFTISQIVFIMN
ncbi:MFS transporter [bacterium]|nr:MFS transporter [bacterium]